MGVEVGDAGCCVAGVPVAAGGFEVGVTDGVGVGVGVTPAVPVAIAVAAIGVPGRGVTVVEGEGMIEGVFVAVGAVVRVGTGVGGNTI